MDKPYLLYVGNAYPHKNLNRAIEAASESHINFGIVSSRGIFTQRLEKTIKKLVAEKYVKLLGFVPDEELKELYKGSEAFIFPSTYEGFGLPGLEAMAAGTVVIASDIPVFREIYKNNALYFNPYDYTSIVRCIKDVVSMDKGKRENMIKEGKKHVENFSWKKMARETIEVYNETLE